MAAAAAAPPPANIMGVLQQSIGQSNLCFFFYLF
jgi:hypothetical protein